jgi:hypothetical protein
MTPVHASRSLSKLRARGVVARRNGRLKIVDPGELRNIADNGWPGSAAAGPAAAKPARAARRAAVK